MIATLAMGLVVGFLPPRVLQSPRLTSIQIHIAPLTSASQVLALKLLLVPNLWSVLENALFKLRKNVFSVPVWNLLFSLLTSKCKCCDVKTNVVM